MNPFDDVHESPFRAVIAITGGGSEAIGRLLQYGNASKTLLEAVVPYHPSAMDSFLGFTPTKYCSPEVTRQLAVAAYRRSLLMADNSQRKYLLGLALTAKLAKPNGEREGRAHEIHVAFHNCYKTVCQKLTLIVPRTRFVEEQIASTMLLNLLRRETTGFEEVLDIEENIVEISRGLKAIEIWDFDKPKKDWVIPSTKETTLIFPGSFNPCHKQHVELAKAAFKTTGQPVQFEISLKNAEKPPLDHIDLAERLETLVPYQNEDWFGGVIATNTPFFKEKVVLFPKCTFIVGTDTINRIADRRYYRSAKEHMRVWQFFVEHIKFLVFERQGVSLCDNAKFNLDFAACCRIMEMYDDGTSSTEIRNEKSPAF